MSHMKPIQPASSPQGILPRDRPTKLNRHQREGFRDNPGLGRPRPLGGPPTSPRKCSPALRQGTWGSETRTPEELKVVE
eukprot:9488670-Pyramimonas_sp.AAC.2